MINHLMTKRLKIWVYIFLAYTTPLFAMSTDLKNDNPGNETFSAYIGKGYNILFGYPLPNNELIEDPGFRKEIFDTRNSLDIINNVACQKDEYFSFVEDINDVTELAMDNINVEELNTNIIPFSASMPYKSYFTDLEIKRKKYIVAQNTCVHTYVTHNLRDSAKNINKDFLLVTDKLPILSKEKIEKECQKMLYLYNSNNERCSKSIRPWVDFFQKYGTHLVVSAHFGGKTFNSLEISLDKLEEIKIYSYKYAIRNVPYLNVFKAPLLLQEVVKRKGRGGGTGLSSGSSSGLSGATNRQDGETRRTRRNVIEGKNSSLDIKGGNQMDEEWKELTYEVWKNSIYTNMRPVHLDLISLSSFMRIEKKQSYDIGLAYYNNLYSMDKENYYLSRDITDVLSDGKQITGSGKGSLILSCPVGYVKSTGFIFTFDTSEKIKGSNGKEGRMNIYPCHNKGEYDISCLYINKNVHVISFGWMYCVKHSFVKFETIHAKRSYTSHGKNAHGKNAHGKNAHGKNAHGKNAHGKNAHGKNAHGKNAHGKNAHGKKAHGKKAQGKKAQGKKALEKETLEKEALKKKALEKEAIEKEALKKKALEKEAIEKEALEIKCSDGYTLAFGFKIKLEKEKNLENVKIKPCALGDSKCIISHTKNNSEYLLWGFCVPLSFHSIRSLQVTYIEESHVTSDVQGSCSDQYKNKYDNIFLGFSFSFDKELENFEMFPCTMKSKHCVSKIGKKKIKNYIGMLLLCRNDGGVKRNFTHY
ncbi:perforin-like protein 4 [Plasmodium gonderi]|uniref:Perforin-like protein 4 n=1 Tax=Plasmodium gonderi TaxID=77519 RepID=A0A1Y1JB00_PLAGO|nr:perforin-like protein 4 [Plasmodium gonderi]GAW79711.1 perforin-like protein 4 [Plasmodium gonderi]